MESATTVMSLAGHGSLCVMTEDDQAFAAAHPHLEYVRPGLWVGRDRHRSTQYHPGYPTTIKETTMTNPTGWGKSPSAPGNNLAAGLARAARQFVPLDRLHVRADDVVDVSLGLTEGTYDVIERGGRHGELVRLRDGEGIDHDVVAADVRARLITPRKPA